MLRAFTLAPMWRRGYYVRKGYSMSRRGRIAILNNEFPIGYFMHLFGMGQTETELMLVYMGVHHTGRKAELTKFYRLPDKDNTIELANYFDAFHSISADQKKFIDFMSQFLQKDIFLKNKKLPGTKKPRKRRKRNRYYSRRRSRLESWYC